VGGKGKSSRARKRVWKNKGVNGWRLPQQRSPPERQNNPKSLDLYRGKNNFNDPHWREQGTLVEIGKMGGELLRLNRI